MEHHENSIEDEATSEKEKPKSIIRGIKDRGQARILGIKEYLTADEHMSLLDKEQIIQV